MRRKEPASRVGTKFRREKKLNEEGCQFHNKNQRTTKKLATDPMDGYTKSCLAALSENKNEKVNKK